MESVALGFDFSHTRACGQELLAVESLAEALGGFCGLFIDFFVELGKMVFDEHVGAVALLGVAVVDQRVVESVDMARCFPDCGVHEYRRIDAHDILVEQSHGIPPVALYVVLEFYAVLAVVVHGGQSVVDFAGGEYKAVFFGVGNDFFENVVLLSHCMSENYSLFIKPLPAAWVLKYKINQINRSGWLRLI